jgi:AmmeMemoRadiSam system protein B
MVEVRLPAVAGRFYPADRAALDRELDGYLAEARRARSRRASTAPVAIITPHAGTVYSGPIAARAWDALARWRGRLRRVVLAGPAHHAWLRGIALPSASSFRTPLGDLAVDDGARLRLMDDPAVIVSDSSHAPEHCLEVNLPFLQKVLGDVPIVPLLVGAAEPGDVARVLSAVWDDDTVVAISTDLSHHLSHADALRRDGATAVAIREIRPQNIAEGDACGRRPVQGLLTLARERHLSVEVLDLRTSGDTAGGRNRVVGYGAFALYGAPTD